ncbi:MAG: hypothetical protein JNM89_04095 [Hyphomicrobiaceae bacterium]|nr:hypothetical protein [Hyphomicrobiaceae bacterium]
MTFLLLQTFLLMAAAYFLGAFIGCMLRRIARPSPDVGTIHSTEAALAATAAAAAVAPASDAAKEPRVEYVPPAGGSDTRRFERALTSAGSGAAEIERVHLPTPAAPLPAAESSEPSTIIVPPRSPEPAKPAPAFVIKEPVPAKPAAPAAVEAPKPVTRTTEADRISVAAASAAAAAAAAMIANSRTPGAESPKPATAPVAPKPVEAPKPIASTSAAPGIAAAAAGGGSSGVVAEVRLGTVPPADRQDLTLLRGIDIGTAKLLNDRGIWHFRDIARWKEAEVEAFNRSLGSPGRVERENWIEQAAVLAAGGFTDYARRRLKGENAASIPAVPPAPAAAAPAPAPAPAAAKPPAPARQDLTLIRGIDETTAAMLESQGIRGYADIAKWKEADVAAANRVIGKAGRVEKEGWIEQAAVLAAGAMTEYARRRMRGETISNKPTATAVASAPKPAAPAPTPAPAPAPAAAKPATPARQDLTLIRGIDEATAAMLESQGIRGYADIAKWKEADVAAANRVIGKAGRVEQEGWIEQATVLAAGAMTEYARRRMRGESISAKPTATAVASAPKAAAPAQAPAPPPAPAPAPQRSATSAANAVAAAVAAAAASANRGAGASDRPAPATSAPAAPAVAADLLQRIRGIDSVTERLLIANGITRHGQIAAWSPDDVARVEGLLGAPGRIGRENWVEQAQILAGGTESADGGATRPARLADAIRENTSPRAPRQDVGALRSVRSEALRPGPADAKVGSSKPASATDDLKRIRGVGVLIEKKLNALGIKRYEQVASWTADDIEAISQSLDFRGRIERENWIEQARILAAGGHTEFSRRLDRSDS